MSAGTSQDDPVFVPRNAPLIGHQVANFLGGVANSATGVLIPWIALELSGSSATAGAVLALAGLSVLAVGPFLGSIIHRYGARPTGIASDLLSLISVALIPLFAWLGWLTIGTLIVLAVLGALFDPAGYLARKTMINPVSVASGRPLERVNGIHEAIAGMGWVLGPALAAACIAWLGAVPSMWVMAGCFALAIMALLSMGHLPRLADEDEDHGNFWQSTVAGFKALRADRPNWVFLLAGVVLLGVYLPIETIAMSRHFKDLDEPGQLGLVLSALALGAVVGSLLFEPIFARVRASQMIIWSVALMGVAVLAMSALPGIVWFTLLGFAFGMSWGPVAPLENMMIQKRIPSSLQSQVFGLQMSLMSVGAPLGSWLLGVLVDARGPGLSFFLCGIVFLAISAWLAWSGDLKPLDSD